MSTLEQPVGSARAFGFDLVEKGVITVLLGVLVARMAPNAIASGDVLPLLLLFSESMVVAFILLRRRTQDISMNWRDWAFGLAGTVAPLLVVAGSGQPVASPVLCGVLMLAGLCLNIAAKLTLRRSFGVVAANRGVKIGGPYRLIRHPMYAGYILTQIGFLLAGPNWWNFGVYALALALQIARIRAEERVLSKDPAYAAMMQRVRYRLVPFIF